MKLSKRTLAGVGIYALPTLNMVTLFAVFWLEHLSKTRWETPAAWWLTPMWTAYAVFSLLMFATFLACVAVVCDL